MKSKGRKTDQTAIGKLQINDGGARKRRTGRGTERLLQERDKGKVVEDAEGRRGKTTCPCAYLLLWYLIICGRMPSERKKRTHTNTHKHKQTNSSGKAITSGGNRFSIQKSGFG